MPRGFAPGSHQVWAVCPGRHGARWGSLRPAGHGVGGEVP